MPHFLLHRHITTSHRSHATHITMTPQSISRHMARLLLVACLSLASPSPSYALLSPLPRAQRKTAAYYRSHRAFPCRVKSPENGVDENKSCAVNENLPAQQEPSKTIPPPPRDPSPQQVMAAMGTSPRRILLSFASASGIALAANFLGITSRLLEAVPESTVEATGLDTYFPRGR